MPTITKRNSRHRLVIEACHVRVFMVNVNTGQVGNQIDDIPIDKNTKILDRRTEGFIQLQRTQGKDDYRGLNFDSLESVVDGSGLAIAGIIDDATLLSFLITLRDGNCCDGCI